ncbi:MAG: hypothetical protein J6S14_19685 [Clostridia bacterium]|nr:hypothetical protein [Clostridia bacterium]
MLTEAQSFWEAIKNKVLQICRAETKNTLRMERYTVTTAPDGAVIGVTLPYGTTELMLPYSKEVAEASVGDVVLVAWWGSMSNAKVYYFANGYEGSSGGGGGGGTSDYADLSNKPQINGVTLVGNKSAAQLSLGTYSKPSSGIPSTDFASDVQTSLGKADTALQKAGGTMTGAIAMGGNKVTGLGTPANDGDAATKKYVDDEIAGIGTVFNIKGDVATVNDLPASGNTVGDVYYVQSVSAAFIWLETTAHPTGYWEEFGEPIDLSGYIEKPTTASANQFLMFNGTLWVAANKPTYTPSEIGAEPAVEEVVVSTGGSVTQALDSGKIYKFTGALTALTLTLNAATAPAQYHFSFSSGASAVSPFPISGVTMPSGFAVEANMYYEVDVLDGYGIAQAW